jgi:hypothetical protein
MHLTHGAAATALRGRTGTVRLVQDPRPRWVPEAPRTAVDHRASQLDLAGIERAVGTARDLLTGPCIALPPSLQWSN